MAKKVKHHELRPNMILAENIPHPHAYKSMIEAGTILTDYHIRRLKMLDIEEFYVIEQENLSRALTITERLKKANECYWYTYEALDQLFRDVRCGKNIKIAPIKKTVSELVDYLNLDRNCMLQLRILKNSDSATLNHSINVSVFAILLGQVLDYSREDLIKIGLAGLLHDVGKNKIPTEILLKKSPLQKEEFEMIKNHPYLGYILLKSGDSLEDRVLNAVLHHHEKCDGSGYPEGLKEEQLDTWTKIITIADIYDALSSDRSYRNKYLPHIALEHLMTEASKGILDSALMSKFMQNISIYPVGVKVLLSSNQVGEVIGIPRNIPWRPTILVGEKEIPLTNNPNLSIVSIVSGDQTKERCANQISKRVLVVDDSPFMRLKLKTLLEEQGHQIVGEAANGLEAVYQYDKLLPEVVFLDITMPEMDGLTALKEILIKDTQANVVMISALQQRNIVLEAIETGAKNFVIKPFKDEKLKEILESI